MTKQPTSPSGDGETRPRGRHFKVVDGEPVRRDDPRVKDGAKGSDASRSQGSTSPSDGGDDAAAKDAPSQKTLTDLAPIAPQASTHAHRHRRRKKKSRKGIKIALAVVAVLVLAGVGAVFAVQNSIQSGKSKLLESATVEESQAEQGIVEYEGVKYRRKSSVVSVAVLGFDRSSVSTDDGKAGQADAIMVLAIDTSTNEMTIIAVPRDSMVTVDQYVGGAYIGQTTEQLCLAFSYGDGYETSCEYTVDAVSRVLLDTPIQYYYAIDMSGIAPINDSVGGVTLTPIMSIPGTIITEGQEITLYGDNAYDYLHWRDTSVGDSAMTRQQRQEQYLRAFATKVLSNAKGGDISSLLALYNTAGAYSVTNLGIDEFAYLATVASNGGVGNLATTSLAGEYAETDSQYAELYLDSSSVYETVLSVYYEPVEGQTATEAE